MSGIRPDRTFSIGSIREYIEVLDNLRVEHDRTGCGHPTTFRGQRRWRTLLPSLTRKGGPAYQVEEDKILRVERKLLDEFMRRLGRQQRPTSDYWDAAIRGQHHRLPTRLLDWTELPLVGLFFAVEGEPEKNDDAQEKHDDGKVPDSVVIGTHGNRLFTHELDEKVGANLWSLREAGPFFFIPNYLDDRIFPQRSVLSVWRDPAQPFENVSRDVWRFDVAADRRIAIQRELSRFGITQETLFPGLDGAAAYLQWKAVDERWGT